MTKVLVLVGSTRSGGNTGKLLSGFLKGAVDAGGQVHEVAVAELDIQGWSPLVECPDVGSHQPQDDFDRVSQELVAADVIVVASPVYFRNVPAQLKALIDRSQCLWLRKHVDKKPLPPSRSGYQRRRGVFLSVGGNKHEHFQGAIETIQSFFDVYEIDYWGELLFGDMDAQGDVGEEPLAFQEAYALGFRAVTEGRE